MAYELRTFADIYNAIREELGIPSGDTTAIARIKRNINQIYLEEVVPFKRWPWLIGSIDVALLPYESTGTVSVTQASQNAHLTTAPAASRQGYWFSTSGSNKRYRVKWHSTPVTITFAPSEGSNFIGTTASAHGLKRGDAVSFITTGTLPNSLTASQVYYVKTVVGYQQFTISETSGGDYYDGAYSSGSGTHTVYSHTLVLETPYEETTAATASYKLWTDAIPLPVECRETVEVTRDGVVDPLDGVGLQEFRATVNLDPKREGEPYLYHTQEALDPAPYEAISGIPSISTYASDGLVRTIVFNSSVASYLSEGDHVRIYGVSGTNANHYNGDWVISSVSTTTITYTANTALYETTTGEYTIPTILKLSTEKAHEHSRRLLVYPSLRNKYTPLHVDFLKKTPPLTDDTDEPVIPLGDRSVLYYGACAMSWDRMRNPDAASKNDLKYSQKLAKMAGRYEDSTDHVQLKPSRLYLAAKRRLKRGSEE